MIPGTRSYEAWLAEVCEAFDLESGSTARRLHGGTANVSYVVDAPQRVIVTFCLELSLERVEQLATVLGHLESHGVETNRLLRSREGRTVHVVDGVPAIVKTYIEGRALQSVDESRARGLGGVLARLNGVPVPDGYAVDHAMNRATMKRLAARGGDSDFSPWLLPALEALPTEWKGLPVGLVHGDLAPDNVLERPDGTLVPIDFEEACLYPLVFDLGMSLVNLANVDSLSQNAVAALLAGYSAERELLPAERESVPAMLEYSALMTASWRHDLAQREGPPPGELRDWRDAQATHRLSLEWRRTGVWRSLLAAPTTRGGA